MQILRQVYAQAAPTTVANPLGTRFPTLAAVFALVINIVIGVGVALVIVFLILAGIQYITARGDAKAADQARGSLTNAIIGFVIVLFAISLKAILANLIGASVASNQIIPF